MKCWAHPEVDAVAICVSCGKGLCRDCSIVITGNNYCKACVESEKWRGPPTRPLAAPTPTPTAPPIPPKTKPTPTPKGRPSKAQFTVGGIGSVFNVIAAIPLFILAFMLVAAIVGGYAPALEYYVLFFLPFGGIIMAGIGYLGIRRNYGSAMGIASFAFAIVTLVLLLLFSLAGITFHYANPEEWATAQVIQCLWFIPFGIMQILWGATHIKTRKFTGKSRLSLATGIILITAGSLTMILVSSMMGIALFFVAEIMASILFFTSEIPEAVWP